MGIIVLIFGVCLPFIIFYLDSESNDMRISQYQHVIDKMFKEYGFNPSQIYLSDCKSKLIAFDEKKYELCVMDVPYTKNKLDEADIKFVSCKDLLQVELLEDDFSVTKTERTSQIGSVLLGTILAGGFGAVVGALTSKKVNKKHVDKLVLQIVVNDLNNPVYQVNFLRNSMSKESKSYQEIFNKANHWYKLLSVIIKRNDELDQQAIIN